MRLSEACSFPDWPIGNHMASGPGRCELRSDSVGAHADWPGMAPRRVISRGLAGDLVRKITDPEFGADGKARKVAKVFSQPASIREHFCVSWQSAQ